MAGMIVRPYESVEVVAEMGAHEYRFTFARLDVAQIKDLTARSNSDKPITDMELYKAHLLSWDMPSSNGEPVPLNDETLAEALNDHSIATALGQSFWNAQNAAAEVVLKNELTPESGGFPALRATPDSKPN